MPVYHERLWPAPWLYIATALVMPASLLVFLPINLIVGVVVAIVLYAGCIGLLLSSSAAITVENGVLTAGRARVPVSTTGEVSVHRGDDARAERGVRLDARAWLLIRGWVDPVIRVSIVDDHDPTPYWLISTRHPENLAAALESQRASAQR
jgi:hypothetical protein